MPTGNIEDGFNISEELSGSPGNQENISEGILISEALDISGSMSVLINNNLSLLKEINSQIKTDVKASEFGFVKCSTQLVEKYINNTLLYTNLSLRLNDYSLLEPNTLDSIVCYLDGVELTDINYDSLKIKITKNSTPSSAEFELKRYYDKYDYKLDDTLSQISNKNKIEIYDGIKKIFIGYITKITCVVEGESVFVVAEDARYKLRDNSLQIYYGFYSAPEKAEKIASGITIYENTKTALFYVLNQAVSLGYISGYGDLSFGFIPEGVEAFESYSELIDTLLTSSGNYFWYLDLDEKICFGKLGEGSVKELSLNSETEHPHIYNIINHSISLNKTYSNFTTALKIKFNEYQHKTYTRWNQVFFSYPNNLEDEFTFFLFRRYVTVDYSGYLSLGNIKYIGEGASYSPSSSYEIIYYATGVPYFYHVSQQMKYNYITPESITIGIGNTTKTTTVSVTQKTRGTIWKEISGEELRNYYYGNEQLKIYADSYEIDGIGMDGLGHGAWGESAIYLCEITEEGNDTQDYILDGAYFELSQNNALLTEGNIEILLDAVEYFGINLSNRVNVSNTKQTGIYGNPLNISEINIDCSNRLCTIGLSNEGKTFYSRTVNINKNYNKQKINVKFRKEGT